MAFFCRRYVPQELVNIFIYHLRDDKTSLKSCSLVSRHFTEASQRHLFRKFALLLDDDNDASTQANTKQFRALLVELPVQLSYVHNLLIGVGFCGPSTPALLDVIDHLVNLKRVLFDCEDCSLLDERLVVHCCKLPITHFSLLYAPNFPGHHLRHCTTLQHLTCIRSSFSSPECAEQRPGRLYLPPPPLNSMLLSGFFGKPNNEHWIRSPQCPISTRNIQALAIRTNKFVEIESARSFIQAVSSTLESLAIQPYGLFGSPDMYTVVRDGFVFVDLSTLPRLRCLTFSIFDFHAVDYLSFILTQLFTVSPANYIETLHILVHFRSDALDLHLPTHFSQYQRLDDCLFESFKYFRAVRIVFYTHARDIDDEHLIRGIEDAMPKSFERKMLLVDVSHDNNWSGLGDDFPKTSTNAS